MPLSFYPKIFIFVTLCQMRFFTFFSFERQISQIKHQLIRLTYSSTLQNLSLNISLLNEIPIDTQFNENERNTFPNGKVRTRTE